MSAQADLSELRFEAHRAQGQEPIRNAGGIQPHGFVLVVHTDDLLVCQCSANAVEWLGHPLYDLLGQPLAALLPPQQAEETLRQIREAIGGSFAPIGPVVFPCGSEAVQGLVHRSDALALIEWIPIQEKPVVLRAPLSALQKVHQLAVRLAEARDVEPLCQLLCDGVRDLSGYDRVVVYRFDIHGNGQILGESRRDDLEPLLGRRFPALVIPEVAQNRGLRPRVKILYDVEAAALPLLPPINPVTGLELDLSSCSLRSFAPVHRNLLHSRGVRATLLISLVVQGQLWGLIACHHEQPRWPSWETTEACDLLAELSQTYLQNHQDVVAEHQMSRMDLVRFRRAVESTQEAVAFADAREQTIFVNKAFATLFGHDADSLQNAGGLPGLLVDARQVQQMRQGLGSSEGSWQGEAWLRPLQGDPIPVAIMADAVTEDRRRIGSIYLCTDLRERVRTEQSLRLRDRAIHAVSQGIAICDAFQPDHPILFTSPGFTRITGYSAEEVLGRNCRFLQGRDTDRETVHRMREAIRAGQPFFAEILNYTKNGTPFWNGLSISPVHDDQGALLYFVGVMDDITGRRKLEEQLRQSQKMEAVGRLAGGVAHDFNNMLTVIYGYSEIMLSRLPVDSAQVEFVREIQKAGQRAALLTEQLLAFSRQGVHEPQVVDLNVVVADLKKMLARLVGEDIEMTVSSQPGLWRIKADPGQLGQVIMNLVINARDAMPRGGKLTLETANVELDESYSNHHPPTRPGRYVMLAVSDTGHGIDQATLPHIFDPFFTTKEVGKGTGLGLSVVHGIVTQAQGHLGVYSEVGKGTTFKVYLPRVDGVIQMGGSRRGLYKVPSGKETILVTEDDVSIRSLVRQVLEGAGYTVLEAANGAEAIYHSNQSQLHLLLTDVVMPGMGGREIAEALLARHPFLKVLYMSGYTDDAVVRHGVLEAEVHFLQKPFTTVALAHKVREVLDSEAVAWGV